MNDHMQPKCKKKKKLIIFFSVKKYDFMHFERHFPFQNA